MNRKFRIDKVKRGINKTDIVLEKAKETVPVNVPDLIHQYSVCPNTYLRKHNNNIIALWIRVWHDGTYPLLNEYRMHMLSKHQTFRKLEHCLPWMFSVFEKQLAKLGQELEAVTNSLSFPSYSTVVFNLYSFFLFTFAF